MLPKNRASTLLFWSKSPGSLREHQQFLKSIRRTKTSEAIVFLIREQVNRCYDPSSYHFGESLPTVDHGLQLAIDGEQFESLGVDFRERFGGRSVSVFGVAGATSGATRIAARRSYLWYQRVRIRVARIVIPKVVGSNPISHPLFLGLHTILCTPTNAPRWHWFRGRFSCDGARQFYFSSAGNFGYNRRTAFHPSGPHYSPSGPTFTPQVLIR
jgi:hypothetical protein